MRRILKIAIYTAIFFYFIFILYIFFSPTEKIGSEKTNTTKTTSTKTVKKSTKQIPLLKENKINIQNKKNIQNEKIVYVQMCPSSNKKKNKAIIDSYVLCGDDIQTCPPPMPPAKCSCKASNNFFNMFDGTH